MLARMQSLVTPFGYRSESCGYCKDDSSGRRTPNSRASYYISSKSLSTQVYQTLVDRGWRRSGTIFYKPDVLRHCCPHYTIRLPVASFTPAKEHRQTVNRWNKHILGEQYAKEAARLYPKSKEEKTRQRSTFDLAAAVHESEYGSLKRPPEPAHRFEVTLEPDNFTPDKYALFQNYQQHVHHEDASEVSQNGFKRFLCHSPLQRTSRTVDGKTQHLGSYHQCYRVDGRLIAMAVLDLLPHCVSGVYFIYHSDFEKWGLGKVSAMREAALALEGGYQYYYMGYYIHSCAKMRYKGHYKPSYVLDPETYDWNPLDGEVRQLLDKKSFVSLSREHRLRRSRTDSNDAAEARSGAQEDPQDTLDDYLLRSSAEASEAVEEGLSLFDLKVPGLMTAEEIKQEVLLDRQAIQLRRTPFTVEAQDLASWEDGDTLDPKTLKGIIGELVACIGPEAAKEVVIDFG